jgi:cobalt-precorrin 5A hydrolase/precorrin-3B C17-methyltransferase
MKIAFVVLSAGGQALAQQLQPAFPGATLHGLEKRVDDADITFADTVAHLRALHRDGIAIVGFCAAGILVRALAPLLGDKRRDAPVVAMAEDGSVAVPLIGGHRGANDLARKLATACKGTAAITTAGDLNFGFSLDNPPPGWKVGNPDLVKTVTAALLSDAKARLEVETGSAEWLAGAPWRDQAAARVLVTDRDIQVDDQTLLLHPPVLAIGVGCERDTSPDELIGLVTETLLAAGLVNGAVASVGSIDLKMDEPAVHDLAAALRTPIRFFDAPTLESEAPRLRNPSDIVFRETGCHGVAEGAALALAGSDAVLVVPKRKSRRATCAIARAPRAIDPLQHGTERGHLAIVGLGPGDSNWRSPEATGALDAADYIIGYDRYLELIADIAPLAERRGYGLGQEAARVRDALTLAGEGHRVALVCSGDAGIYALASLVFEMIESDADPLWRRAEITVAPGITAMQAAAARAGAPLGHDFCAISLSDLLTPREAIIRRLGAAASGDFVTALYNPQSQSRRDLLARARDIFAQHRPPSTPVVIARNLGRDDESLIIVPLSEMDVEAVDMLTIVIIGNSETRMLHNGAGPKVYTPRGYGAVP